MWEIIIGVGGWFAGSLCGMALQKYNGKLQTMSCYYMEDDVLSKIPQRNASGSLTQNVHKKHFRLKNTTNMDIKRFKVVFQFDMSSNITDCYSRSKEGINRQRIKKNNRLLNQAEASIENFNRGDIIDFHITVVNVTENEYYVREFDAIGFKIKCKDKREYTIRSKSEMSNELLIRTP